MNKRGNKINPDRIYYCPVCEGTGAFELPTKIKQSDLDIKRYLVGVMHKKGYSIRQIMRALNYKSPHSVHILINRNAKI